MKKHLLLLLSFVAISTLQAQENPSVEKKQFKINVLLPGVVYEHGFDAKNTLYSELSFGISYRYNSYLGSDLSFIPIINEQFRHYYNLEKRAAKGRTTSHNSGTFVALAAFYNFKSITTNDSYLPTVPSVTIAPLWGFQRTYKGNFNMNLNMGVGYNMDQFDNEFVPVVNFTLGWVIGQ